MHERTIREKLKKKFEQFLKLFDDDPTLKDAVARGTIITGGCIPSMILDENVNDYDMYFRSRHLADRVAVHFVKQMPRPAEIVNLFDVSDNVSYYKNGECDDEEHYTSYRGIVDKLPGNRVFIYIPHIGIYNARKESSKKLKKGEVVFVSPNAISLAGGYQLITRFFGEPEEIHENFDYDHCKCYWKSWDRELVLPQTALLSIATKELRYNGSLYPVTSVLRTRKFIGRGWSINAAQYIKMSMQISELNLTHLPTLVDQLMGVDIIYLMDFINALKIGDNDIIETEVACKIVDQIFDSDEIAVHDGYGEDENDD